MAFQPLTGEAAGGDTIKLSTRESFDATRVSVRSKIEKSMDASLSLDVSFPSGDVLIISLDTRVLDRSSIYFTVSSPAISILNNNWK